LRDASGEKPKDANVADPLCATVTCATPPEGTCADATNLRGYASVGTCASGVCSYASSNRVCAGGCANNECIGAWSAMDQTSPPSARYGHAAVWTGTEMIVWGGATSSTSSLGDGARYNPVTKVWQALSSVGAPAARRDHTAVWTGTEMIVWGGARTTQGQALADGGRYNPATDTWTPIVAPSNVQARFGHTAVWNGSDIVLWGGAPSSATSYSDGWLMNPTTSQWRALSATNAPPARRDHSAIWTGTEMIVWGGSTIHTGGGTFSDVYRFDFAADRWASASASAAPAARFMHSAVWTGREMLVWGGAITSTVTYGDGARLKGVAWAPMPSQVYLGARRRHTAVWTGSAMIVWGGTDIVDGFSPSRTGALFGF
jgi:hypothetical protein